MANKENFTRRFDPEDVERWKAAAKKEGRTLTNWMEYHLNELVNQLLNKTKQQ